MAPPTQKSVNLPAPPKYPAGLNVDWWDIELGGDPDRDFLMDGIRNGFHVIDKGAILSPATMDNYRSATDPIIRNKVENQILTEIE